MHASELAQDAQQDKGWSDVTLIGVLCDYIENQQANDAFEEYLLDRD